MVVKNITTPGASGNVKPIPVVYIIPPDVTDAKARFVIETAEGNVIELEDDVRFGDFFDGCTSVIGSFNFKILDPNKTYYNKVNTFDKILIYADYGEPTSLRFAGYIERRGYTDYHLTISGRSLSMKLYEKKATYNSNGEKYRSDIIKEILTTYFPDINIEDVSDDEVYTNISYQEIPITTIFSEICGDHHDFYLDCNNNFHYFLKGSRQNDTEAISETVNHLESPDNSDDTESTYTSVRVYGKDYNGIPVLSTVYGSDILGGVEKENKISNKNLIDADQSQLYALSLLDSSNKIPRIGSITSLFLPTLLPGEKLFISVPRENIDPQFYEIVSYKHTLNLEAEKYMTTTVQLKKLKQDVSTIIKSRISFENFNTTGGNTYNNDNSEILLFTNSYGTFNNTEIFGGVLKLFKSSETGYWESGIYEFPLKIENIHLQWAGSNLNTDYNATNAKLYISTDAGITWKGVMSGTKETNINIPSGKSIKFRVNFMKNNQSVSTIGMFYDYSSSNI